MSKKRLITKPALIQLRVSSEEKRKFERTAKKSGLNLSSWLRYIALREAEGR